jgi:hypothetical protein
MTVVAERELTAPYSHVVSENAVREVTRLLQTGEELGHPTSVALSQSLASRRRSILELEGLGKEVWEGVDPKRYIDELRNEWDSR